MLIARDRPFAEGGNRVVRPVDDAVWNFTGAEAGGDFWWFPQNNWSGVWPDFNVCVNCGVPYSEEDPRINAQAPPARRHTDLAHVTEWGIRGCIRVLKPPAATTAGCL